MRVNNSDMSEQTTASGGISNNSWGFKDQGEVSVSTEMDSIAEHGLPLSVGLLVFQGGVPVYANRVCADLLGYNLDELKTFTLEEIFNLIHPTDYSAFMDAYQAVLTGHFAPILPNARIHRKDGSTSRVDLLVNISSYRARPAVQVNFIDISQRKLAEVNLQWTIQRLQIVRDIQSAILSDQGEDETACAALHKIKSLVPGFRAGIVTTFSQLDLQEEVLAAEYSLPVNASESECQQVIQMSIDHAGYDRKGLAEALLITDFSVFEQHLIHGLDELEIRSLLAVTCRSKDETAGSLLLASSEVIAFQEQQIQVAREVADALAVAVERGRELRLDSQRRKEAEWMRDVMASLARAANLKQSLEIILVNLHNIIRYDRASMFLLDESQLNLSDEGQPAARTYSGISHPAAEPLVAELLDNKHPLVVADIQGDARFHDWPDMESIRGWMGVPLMAGQEMIGFLSIGSLEVGTYTQMEAEMIGEFTSQVAEVIEKAWIHEQSHRKTEELEVLTNITFALGQAESHEDTMAAIVSQVSNFFHADCGTYLVIDERQGQLRVKYSQNDSLIGLVQPDGNDLLWRVVLASHSAVISDCHSFLEKNRSGIYLYLLDKSNSAALIPLKTGGKPYGVLCLTFDLAVDFTPDDINLYNTIAEIAGASLHRVAILEALEGQVSERTKHLATLYDIHSIASEQIDLEKILGEVLQSTLQAFMGKAGCIHLLDPLSQDLHLIVQNNIPTAQLVNFQELSLKNDFWADLLQRNAPWIGQGTNFGDASLEVFLPASGFQSCLIAPLRVKNRPLGLLTILGNQPSDYSSDEITLFQTIADQVGIYVERTRLIEQSEKAAVTQERQRLARELHDSVTQLLYSQVLFAGASMKVLKQGNLELLEQHLARMEKVARQALREMRLLVYELRPYEYVEDGLPAALQRRLDSVEKRSDIHAQLLIDGELNLDEYQEMALYLITQEALNNTLKHAGAGSVSVKITADQSRVRLEVEDDGCGFDLKQNLRGGGMGLANMLERAAALGGQMQIYSEPGKGTRIMVEIEASHEQTD